MAEHEQKVHKEEPIIIKKRGGSKKGAHHGGSWKVAYADFVTAMMAFFIVMWILGQSDKIKNEVVAYFKDPGAFNFVTGKRTIPIDLNKQPSGEGKGKKNDFYFVIPKDQRDTLINKAAEQLKKNAIQDSIKAFNKLKDVEQSFKKYFVEQTSKNPAMIDIINSISVQMTKEGLRIELIESKESLFFEIGSAKLKDKAKLVLAHLAEEIGKLPNFVDIEGHTDSRKYSDKATYTNWELSADRSNSARRLLETKGLWQGQVEKVTGFADRRLRNPDNPFDITNRRVSILIKQLNVSNIINKR